MKNAMKNLLLILAVVGVVGTSGPAAAEQWFDFSGQALWPALGGDLTSYSVVNNNGVIPTPLPLDFANFEYTLVVTGLTLDVDNGGGGQTFSGGTIVLYEDNATPADYANPATFTDGTVLLSGNLTTLSTAWFFSSSGSGNGQVDWTGGTQLGEFAPGDELGWTYVVSFSNRSTVTEPGYDTSWDGKVEPVSEVVPNETVSVGRLKASH